MCVHMCIHVGIHTSAETIQFITVYFLPTISILYVHTLRKTSNQKPFILEALYWKIIWFIYRQKPLKTHHTVNFCQHSQKTWINSFYELSLRVFCEKGNDMHARNREDYILKSHQFLGRKRESSTVSYTGPVLPCRLVILRCFLLRPSSSCP